MDDQKNIQKLLEEKTKYEAEIKLLKQEKAQFTTTINELKEKLELVAKNLEESELAIITGNNKGQILDANKKALKISGYRKEELQQKKVNELIINQETTQKTPSQKKGNPGEIKSEQILVKKDGKKVFVSTKTKVLPLNQYQISFKSINKRKKAELALFEEQKRYQQLADNIDEVLFTASKEMKIIYISGSILKITGFSPEVYYLKPISELLTPISYQLLNDTLIKEKRRLNEDNEAKKAFSINIEIKLLHKHHSSVWVELSAGLIVNQLNETIGYQGIIKNIDTKKKTLEMLNKNTQRYNFAIRSAGSGVWELSADLTKINIDENLLQILGFEKNEPKSYLNDWINLTFKEDRILIIDVLQDILDGKKFSASYECRRIHKNGELVWFTDYVEAVYDSEGKIIELLGTSKNITREKITEEKKFKYYAGLQMMIESTFQFLKFEDLDQIYNYTGQILMQTIPNSVIIISSIDHENLEIVPVKYFGISNPALIKQLENHALIPEVKPCKLSGNAVSLLAQKFLIEFKNGFGEFIEKNKSEQICDTIGSYFSNYRLHVIGMGANNHLTGSISIVQNEDIELQNKEFIEAFISLTSIILEKKKLEIELKKTNETKDKFFSIISHDLKNPFNTFIGFSGLIIQNFEKIGKDKILEFSKLIHDAAVQSHEMMQNLFEWVNSQKGGLKCRPVKIDLDGLINSNIKLFSSEANKKEIEIISKKMPFAEFYADIDMMSTIMRNLISNALKFTNKGGKISISCEKMDDEFRFSVKDNGIGMSKEKINELFNLGYAKSTPGTNMEKGTGLGLLLCHEFVKMHNGTIWVVSEEGKGSEFIFTIPVNNPI